MAALFGSHTLWLWTLVLAVALFFPARRLIWVVSVRREQGKRDSPCDDARLKTLKRRASITAGLLCLFFAAIYVHVVLAKLYGAP
jgi:hypothetical protein